MRYNLCAMYEKVTPILQQKCQLHAKNTILVGFSGGPDSLALLEILLRGDYRVIAAHYNHGLRAESDEDERRAGELAAGLGAGWVSERGDVGGYAAAQRLSIEAAGRQLRYGFLFRQARLAGAAAVAVGHTADDQVETLLMNLLRGAGLSGLKGMPWRALPNAWDREIPLVRPLLATWRTEILAYCQARNLQPLEDTSNQDFTYARNRVRLELIPLLEQYNPEVKKALWRTGESLRSDDEVVQAAVEAAWQSTCLEQGPGSLALDREAFLSLGQGLQRRLARRALASLLTDARALDFEVIERFVEFVTHPSRSGEVDLVGGLRGQVEADRLWLAAWSVGLPDLAWPQAPPEALPVPLAGQVELGQGWTLHAEKASLTAQELERHTRNPDPWQAWLALETLGEGLWVRRRKPGDRMRPLGLGGGSLKVTDLMINCKLPARARRTWPLVCAGEAVVWVPGLRLSHDHRLKPETKQAIHLRLGRDISEAP